MRRREFIAVLGGLLSPDQLLRLDACRLHRRCCCRAIPDEEPGEHVRRIDNGLKAALDNLMLCEIWLAHDSRDVRVQLGKDRFRCSARDHQREIAADHGISIADLAERRRIWKQWRARRRVDRKGDPSGVASAQARAPIMPLLPGWGSTMIG